MLASSQTASHDGDETESRLTEERPGARHGRDEHRRPRKGNVEIGWKSLRVLNRAAQHHGRRSPSRLMAAGGLWNARLLAEADPLARLANQRRETSTVGPGGWDVEGSDKADPCWLSAEPLTWATADQFDSSLSTRVEIYFILRTTLTTTNTSRHAPVSCVAESRRGTRAAWDQQRNQNQHRRRSLSRS